MELFLVLQPGKPGLEVFVTEGAFKRPVLGVQDHVLLQMRPAGEGLQTNLVQKVQRLQVVKIHHQTKHEQHSMTETSSYSTFPAFTLPLPLGKKFLDVVWMKPGRTVKIHDIIIIYYDCSNTSCCNHGNDYFKLITYNLEITTQSK